MRSWSLPATEIGLSSREPKPVTAIDLAVQEFKQQHRELAERAAADPAFAEAWDRAVRYRVAHPQAERAPASAAKARAQVRRARRELELKERAAQAREEAEIEAAVEAGHERQRLEDAVRRFNERAEADRLAMLNEVSAMRLPVWLGPAFDLALRRWMIDEIERRAASRAPDESQVTDA